MEVQHHRRPLAGQRAHHRVAGLVDRQPLHIQAELGEEGGYEVGDRVLVACGGGDADQLSHELDQPRRGERHACRRSPGE